VYGERAVGEEELHGHGAVDDHNVGRELAARVVARARSGHDAADALLLLEARRLARDGREAGPLGDQENADAREARGLERNSGQPLLVRSGHGPEGHEDWLRA
jgi:hypothetical protein